jgi:multicomponent K+:H+ antiporter subunit G
MNVFVEWLVAALLVFGAAFVLLGSLGLLKLPDFFMRLHAPTKASTLGVGAILLASSIHFSTGGNGISLHEILILIFLFITAPVSALMMARAARHTRVKQNERTQEDNLSADESAR